MNRRDLAARSLAAAVLVSGAVVALGANGVAALRASTSHPLLSCVAGTTYTLRATGNLYSVATTTGTTALAGSLSVSGLDAFALTSNGATVVAARQINASSAGMVYSYDVATATTAHFSVAIASGLSVVAGAVDPVSGVYYFAGFSSPGHAGNKFLVYGFDLTSNTQIGSGALAQIPALTSSVTGDLTIDASDRAYVVQSGSGVSSSEVDVVVGSLPATSQATPLALSSKLLTSFGSTVNQFDGASFDANGTLYVELSVGGATPSVRLDFVNPNSGVVTSSIKVTGSGAVTGANGNVDLASCVTPGTVRANENVVSRVHPSDQFSLSVVSNSLTLASATTSGSVNGVQVATAGPVAGVAGVSYTVTELAAAGADLRDYESTYSCVDHNNVNALVASGVGTSVTFLLPAPIGSSGADVRCTFANTPGLTIVKSAFPTTVQSAGTVITYSFLVTNVSAVAIGSLNVVDTPVSPTRPLTSGPNCPVTTLASGASTTCVGTYIVDSADVTNVTIADTAVAYGAPVGGSLYASLPSSATVLASPDPSLRIVKTANPTTVSSAGTEITYSFMVTNSGNVDITNLIVHDTPTAPAGVLDSSPNCPVTQLAPGASTICTATYTVTQTDVDHGSVTDSATVSGTPPVGPSVSSSPSTTTVLAPADPSLSIVKTANPTSVSTTGTVISYTFLVSNTGNVTISSVTVIDSPKAPADPLTSGPTCSSSTLAPGQSLRCFGTYKVTQSDIDNGSICGSATVSGTSPQNSEVTSLPSSATVLASPDPSLRIVKTANPTTVSSAGTEITYSFMVTNSGNVDITNLIVHDTPTAPAGVLDSSPNCPVTQLAPGASTICTATYTVTQTDVDHGSVTDSATVSGTPPVGPSVSSSPSTTTVLAPADPSLSIVKTANPTSVSTTGTVISYTFLVSNTGNVTISSVTVIDSPKAPADPLTSGPTCSSSTLAPGQSLRCFGTYKVTQSDIDNGSICGSATVSGTSPQNSEVTSLPSSATVLASPDPSLRIVKTANPTTVSSAGTEITYSFMVTNSGNVDITNLIVHDTPTAPAGVLDSSPNCPVTQLAPGASTICTATYTVTQTDVDHGSVTDSATVSGTPPVGPSVSSSPSTTTVLAPADPSLSIVKTANPTSVSTTGTVISYTFLVSNTGNVTISSVTVIDLLPGLSAVRCPSRNVLPSRSQTCSATYDVTQSDLNSGSIINRASATGLAPDGSTIEAPISNFQVTAVQSPQITILATSDLSFFTGSGTRVRYSFLVANSGNVDLSRISVVNAIEGISGTACPSSTLEVGRSMTCTATYVTRLDDVKRGSVVNEGVAAGFTKLGKRVNSLPSGLVVPLIHQQVKVTG